ncbi:hypothetical protein OIV83_002957 [Microbotryomycetes sp. JL201]|nr:hypothetical protein OIV83_002957 [Microbotryomycetes sp. JL201]
MDGSGRRSTGGRGMAAAAASRLRAPRGTMGTRVPPHEMMASPETKHETMAPAMHKPSRPVRPGARGSSNGEASLVTFASPTVGRRLKIIYAKIRRRIGNGSAPDDSLGDPTNTDSENGSSFGGGRRSFRSKEGAFNEKDEPVEDIVDEVVVEATGSPEFWKGATQRSDRSRGDQTGTGGTGMQGTGMQSEGSSLRHTYDAASGMLATVGGFVRWRLYPVVLNFFAPRYHDPTVEEAYQKELWYTSKSSAIFGSVFLTVSWVLGVILLPRPWSRWNEINFYVLGPLLNVPLVVMSMLDYPRRHPWVWQPWIAAAVFIAMMGNIIDMKLCHFYVPALKNCGSKDYMGTLYYATGVPVIGLFACYLRRFPALCIIIAWLACVGGLIVPDRIGFLRNVVNVLLFHAFFLWSHYMREMADRRMYTMRAELKIQFKAKQKAQINERKTMDSKRRFSSYIFHEVRVPLNTALLAVQNLQATNAFGEKGSDQSIEYAALEGSLRMMSQVLNDVLDFSRMERGGFLSVSRPFSFHTVMREMFSPLRIDTAARGLALETELDPRIDAVARKSALPDEDNAFVQEGDGWMMGDEMRLRQVVNNLTSNACKFTAAGGKISIRTSLVYPIDGLQRLDAKDLEAGNDEISDATMMGLPSPRLSETHLQRHEAKTSPPTDSVIVVRIEVQDTGVGLRSRDMAENRLFSAYVQTEIGRKQGGKGTGLGLSLVRQIVMLSGGRLGVRSKVGEGSTFWVEMPYKIGTEECRHELLEPRRRTSSTVDRKASTPSSSSDSYDIRLVPSLTTRSSDPTLLSIDESTPVSPMSPPPSFMALEGGQPLAIPEPSPPAPPLPDMAAQSRPTNQHSLSSSSAPPALPPPPTAKATKTLDFEDGPLRVLVVDDDALTRRLMGRMLERLGCLVSTAENGAIALDMLLAGSGLSASQDGVGIDPRSTLDKDAPRNFEITFLDNQMPICSGLQVVNRMRSLGRDDLIVGVTANALLADQEAYIEQGASAVLTKPVSEVDLRRYLILADRKRSGLKDPTFEVAETRLPLPPPPALSRDDD